jgi:hypothetical protein
MENTVNYEQMNFNLPHDVIQLPSGGIFYKSKKKSIKVGYLTAQDENLLSNFDPKLSINESIVLPLLRRKIYEKDLKADELTDGDVESILLFLRNTSFGPEYTVGVKDPTTDQQFTTTIMLDELNIKKTTQKPNEDGLFTIKLPMSKSEVVLKMMTLGDRVSLEQEVRNYPIQSISPVVTSRLNKQIVSLNGDTDRIKIASFIESMPIADSKFIRRFVLDNEPKLDLTREVIAPSGERVMVDITFGVEFFRPFLSI